MEADHRRLSTTSNHGDLLSMKILVYCKNSVGDQKAIKTALSHAKAFNASVDLISVIVESSETPMEFLDKEIEKLSKLREFTFTPEGIPCETKAIQTTLTQGEAIVQYIENHDIDLLIMSIQKRSKLGKLFFGSTTQFIILEAPCDVLTVK